MEAALEAGAEDFKAEAEGYEILTELGNSFTLTLSTLLSEIATGTYTQQVLTRNPARRGNISSRSMLIGKQGNLSHALTSFTDTHWILMTRRSLT